MKFKFKAGDLVKLKHDPGLPDGVKQNLHAICEVMEINPNSKHPYLVQQTNGQPIFTSSICNINCTNVVESALIRAEGIFSFRRRPDRDETVGEKEFEMSYHHAPPNDHLVNNFLLTAHEINELRKTTNQFCVDNGL